MIVPRIRVRVLLLVIGVMELVNCKRMRPAAVKIAKITSTYNPRNLEFLNAFITPGSNSRTFELNATLKADIVTGLRIRVELLLKSTAQMGAYRKIFAYDVDLCKFWEGSVNLPLVKMWLKNIKKFSNFPTACPVESGYYFIQSFKVEARSVPLFVLEGEYMVIAVPYIKSEQNMIANMSLEVEILK